MECGYCNKFEKDVSEEYEVTACVPCWKKVCNSPRGKNKCQLCFDDCMYAGDYATCEECFKAVASSLGIVTESEKEECNVAVIVESFKATFSDGLLKKAIKILKREIQEKDRVRRQEREVVAFNTAVNKGDLDAAKLCTRHCNSETVKERLAIIKALEESEQLVSDEDFCKTLLDDTELFPDHWIAI